MKLKNKHVWYEHFVYLILWVIIFALPVVDFWHNRSLMSGTEIRGMVLHSWLFLAPMLVLFVINDFFLAPKLLLRRKQTLYLISVFTLILVTLMSFSLMERAILKDFRPHRFPMSEKMDYPMEGEHMMPPMNGDKKFEGDYGPKPMDGGPAPELLQQGAPGEPMPSSLQKAGNRPTDNPPAETRRHKHPHQFPNGMERDGVFSLPMAPMISRFLIAVFILGFNVAIKFVFRTISQEERLKEQEKQKLQSELEYLKYQINPHFFMNTLNNIHALIDIDPVKAQETILELSKMMRYVLYDSSNKLISLEKEIMFLRNYIGLMSLRYTNKVRVSMSVPDIIPEVSVPPLLFISFVENAFKHGISYQQESFIDVNIEIEQDRVIFHCENSLITNTDEKKKSPGIGIENTRRRLNLLFGTDYTLSIKPVDNLFKVLLIIPTVC